MRAGISRRGLLGSAASLAIVPGLAGCGDASTAESTVATYPYLRRAIARVRAGAGASKIALIGDSTTTGCGSVAAQGQWRSNGWPVWLAAQLTARGIPTQWANAWGADGSGQKAGSWDSRVVLSGGATKYDLGSLGGWATNCTAAAQAMAFTPSGKFDSVDIYTVGGGNPTFAVNIGGGSSLGNTKNSGGYVVRKDTFTFAETANPTINIVCNGSGGSYIVGVDAYLSTSPALRLQNMGWGGASSVNWAATADTWYAANNFGAVGADAFVICLGICDWSNGTGVSGYTTNLQSIITSMHAANADVILLTPPPSAISVQPAAVQATYVEAVKKLASTNNLQCLDINGLFGSWANMNALGLIHDTNHPNNIGYGEWSGAVDNLLRTL